MALPSNLPIETAVLVPSANEIVNVPLVGVFAVFLTNVNDFVAGATSLMPEATVALPRFNRYTTLVTALHAESFVDVTVIEHDAIELEMSLETTVVVDANIFVVVVAEFCCATSSPFG